MRQYMIVHQTTTSEKYLLRALVFADSTPLAQQAVHDYGRLNNITVLPGLFQVHDMGVVSSFPCPAIQSVSGGHIMIAETASYEPAAPAPKPTPPAKPTVTEPPPHQPDTGGAGQPTNPTTAPANQRPLQTPGNRGKQQSRQPGRQVTNQ